MESLLKAIEKCGSQANLARRISENLPPAVKQPVTPQHVWNWLNRDRVVPAEYCPTIEKVCAGEVLCEELNPNADWAYMRASKHGVKNGRRWTDPKD